jgi:hypothetical protein
LTRVAITPARFAWNVRHRTIWTPSVILRDAFQLLSFHFPYSS